MILWIDDAQWGEDALGFCAHALEQLRCPLLIVLTARDDALAQRPETARRLDALAAHPQQPLAAAGPLDDAQHRQLVEALLGLDAQLAEAIARHTRGNPLFAVQLVGSLVERGQLRVSARGFELAGELPAIPDDLHQVWVERTAHALAPLGAPLETVHWRALELAACLGQEVALPQWRAALAHEGLAPSPQLLEQLRGGHLILGDPQEDGELAFVHAMLRESLERRARERGAHHSAHRTCAHVLAEISRRDPRALARLGHHLTEAGEPERALAPLARGAWWSMETDDLARAEALLARRAELLEQLQIGPDHPARLTELILRGWIHARSARAERAVELAERVERHARAQGHDRLIGEALRLRAKLARPHSLPESTALFEQALVPLARAGAQRSLGKAKLGLGWNRGRSGDADEGLAVIDEAIEDFDRAQSAYWQMVALRAKGYLLSQSGRLDQARACAALAHREAEALAIPSEISSCHTTLGECARAQGDYEQARRHYERADQLDEGGDAINPLIHSFNMAMVELGSGQLEAAEARLEDLFARWGAVTQAQLAALLLAARVACHGARGRWGDFDRELDHLRRELEASRLIDRDITWLLERAAAAAEDAGHPERALRARALGHEQEGTS